MRVEQIGDATLYLGDCRDILPTLLRVDAVVTDPPHGLGKRLAGGSWGAETGGLSWDQEAASVAHILAMGVPSIIWGGNYMGLPPSRGWLVWRKPDAAPSMADAELAWTNLDINTRIISHTVWATREAEGYGHHPTQKPVAVMRWCLEVLPDARTVFDPYMGSGSTGVAAVKLGRKFIGVEIEPRYFDIACRRIRDAYAQPDLFVKAPEPKPEQLSLLGAAE